MAYTQQQLVEMITDAREQYHALLTGKAARVVVDSNGERLEFVAANRPALYAYIQNLESQLSALSQGSQQASGPLHFFF